jgi:hypothetical protein
MNKKCSFADPEDENNVYDAEFHSLGKDSSILRYEKKGLDGYELSRIDPKSTTLSKGRWIKRFITRAQKEAFEIASESELKRMRDQSCGIGKESGHYWRYFAAEREEEIKDRALTGIAHSKNDATLKVANNYAQHKKMIDSIDLPQNSKALLYAKLHRSFNEILNDI